MRIKIKSIKKVENKLRLIKLVKDISGMGLRESKDLTDDLVYNIGSVKYLDILNRRVEIVYNGSAREIDALEHIRNESKNIEGVHFYINDRDIKLLSLGLGSSEECIEEIKNHIDDEDILK